MARTNTTSGSNGSGVGQVYAGSGLLGNGTQPWTFHTAYNRSAFDSANRVHYVNVASGGDATNGSIEIREHYATYAAGRRTFVYFWTTSGYNRFRFQYDLSLAQFGTAAAQPADGALAYFTLVFGSGTSATNHTSTTPALYVDGVRVGLYDAYFGAASSLPDCKDQCLFAADSGNSALLGHAYETGVWSRGLTEAEVLAMHSPHSCSPRFFTRGLELYHSQRLGVTQPEIIPAGVTSVTDTHGSISKHDISVVYPALGYIFPASFPAVEIEGGFADAITEYGPEIVLGGLIEGGFADAVTEYGPEIETGYSSPVLQIRDALAASIEGLTAPDLSGERFTHAGQLMRLPDGAQAHRMFLFEFPSAGIMTQFGLTSCQVEHNFSVRIRYATSVDAAGDLFASMVSEAMTIMRAIDSTSLASIAGAAHLITDGYRTEPAPSEDTDLVIDLIAQTQETSS